MAKSVALQYNTRATYGSLAINAPEITSIPGIAPEYLPQERTAARENVSKGVKVRSKANAKSGISPVTLLSAIIAIGLVVMVIMSYVQLNVISVKSSQYEAQIAELEQDETQLKLAYESAFDFREIEEYATSELGMIKASAGQKVYLSENSEDKAVVIETESKTSGFWSAISDFFASVKEYLS